jgi:WhiB family redox-sensing transcriptional regulator
MMQHHKVLVAARPLAEEDWRPQAACRFTDPELFFPLSGFGKSLEQAAEAKAVCAVCAVRCECLAFATRTRERHGIWGGMTEHERQAGKTDQPAMAVASDDPPYALDAEMRSGVA